MRGRIALAILIGLTAAARASADTDRPIALPSSRWMDERPALPTSPADEAPPERAIPAPASRISRDAMQTIGALGGVIGVILLLRQVLRRVGDPLAARRPSGVVQVLSRFPFGRNQQIVLLQIGPRILCVHQSSGAVSTLCEVVDPGEVADLRGRIEAGTPERQRFERELTRELARPESRSGPGRTTTAAERSPLLGRPVETVDLTRGRSGFLGLFGGSR